MARMGILYVSLSIVTRSAGFHEKTPIMGLGRIRSTHEVEK